MLETQTTAKPIRENLAQAMQPETKAAVENSAKKNFDREKIENISNNQAQENKDQGEKGFFHKIIYDAAHRNVFISIVNAILHGAATVTGYAAVKGDSKIKSINKFFDKTAFLTTRWISPFFSYGLGAIDALFGRKKDGTPNKRFIEGLIKLMPCALLPVVGEANIDTVWGGTASFNQPYDLIFKRTNQEAKRDPKLKEHVDKHNKSYWGNAKLVWQGFKKLIKDFSQGKLDKEDRIYFYNIPLIMIGSLPILLFARQDRDSGFAKFAGLLRNIGGVMGDYGFLREDKLFKKLVGIFCGSAAICDVAKRWVKSEMTAKVLIHLSAALNVAGYAMWNAFSGDEAKKAEDLAVQ